MSTLTMDAVTVTYAGTVPAVQSISLEITAGECLALVGESGCGKSTIAHAALGLLPPSATVDGSIRLCGVEIVGAPERTLRRLRGRVAGLVNQDPFAACNPLRPLHDHVAEAWHAHGEHIAPRAVAERLGRLGIARPAMAMKRYPHQWSGGMLQRANIAAAGAHTPALIVADEPTSALDAERADDTLRGLRDQGAAVLLVSHDIALVARHADRIAVCYAGRIVETGRAHSITTTPRHPYTAGLLAARPQVHGRLPLTLPGDPPAPGDTGHGCAFAPRCRHARALCHTQRPALDNDVACLFPLRRPPSGRVHDDGARPPFPPSTGGPALLTARGLRQYYGTTVAVPTTDLALHRGEIVGVSGPSGCGKSSLLRMLAGIETPTAGHLDIGDWQPGAGRSWPPPGLVMAIFQNATASLDPRWPVWKTVSEPLTAPHRTRLARRARRARARQLLAEVGLGRIDPEARPAELSGGQRQRVAIARALAAEPTLLIADEPTSALDTAASASILHCLAALAAGGTAIVIASHDRPLLDALCHRVVLLTVPDPASTREGTDSP